MDDSCHPIHPPVLHLPRPESSQKPPASDVTRFGSPLSGSRRKLCLVTSPRPNPGLSGRLIQFLSLEIPSLSFSLEPQPGLSAIWVCGYESDPQQAQFVRDLRQRFPRAVILVTGREFLDRWADEAEEAGADFSLPWPASYASVELLLGGSPAGPGPRPVEREPSFRDSEAGPSRIVEPA